jgi:flagellar FliJ protein
MAKSDFRLEQVLNYRREVEKAHKMEFAAAKRNFETASESLQRDTAFVEDLSHQFQQRQQQGISALELQLYADFFQKKRVDLSQRKVQVHELNLEVSCRRESLAEAAKEKKVLETLKEKALGELRSERAEKERAFLEEIALRQKVRGR